MKFHGFDKNYLKMIFVDIWIHGLINQLSVNSTKKTRISFAANNCQPRKLELVLQQITVLLRSDLPWQTIYDYCKGSNFSWSLQF